jgi:transcriptional regulator with XRE-family HTH domain
VPFPDNLRRLRRERFLTQMELAEKAGIRQTSLSRLERGAHPPSMRTLRKLATALGVEPRELADPSEVSERLVRLAA